VNWKRWAFTIASFAAVIGVSTFFIVRWWRAGSTFDYSTRIFTRRGRPVRDPHTVVEVSGVQSGPHRTQVHDRGARDAGRRFRRVDNAGAVGASRPLPRLAESGVRDASALVVLFAELFLESLCWRQWSRGDASSGTPASY
jgi:hypothetical protein